MAVPKYHEMVPLTKLGGHRAGWDAMSTRHGHRGCRGKLRKSSSTQNKTFSQHITFLQLHSLLGRSSQQAGQGLEAELTVKPAPGIIWLSPFPSALSGRATQGRARPLSLYTPLLPQHPQHAKALQPGNFPRDFWCLWDGEGARLTLHCTTSSSPTLSISTLRRNPHTPPCCAMETAEPRPVSSAQSASDEAKPKVTLPFAVWK